nr:uncharacterized protein LOC103248820 [Chlorocebus sabaeus]
MTGSTPSVRALIPEIRSLMLFPAGDKRFEVHPIRIFPLRPSAAETRQTPRAAHPLIEADSGRFRADPRCQGADSIPGRIVRRRGPSGRRASTLGSRCPQRAEIRGTLGHLSASFEPNPRRLPGPDGPSTDSQARVALPGPQGTDTTADVPSTTVSRSQERSTQQRSADPEFSRGETRRPALSTVLPTQPGGRRSPAHPETSLPPSWVAVRPSWSSLGGWALSAGLPSPGHPKQVTLSTLSRPRFGLAHFYLRVRRGKEGKKKSRGDPSQLEEKISKGCPQRRKKPRLYRPSNYNRAFRRMRRDGFPPGPHQKPAHPSHPAPLSGRKDSNSTTRRPPSCCWAVAEAVHGIPQVATAPPPPPSTLEGTSVTDTMARFLFPTPVGLANDRSSSLH